MWRGLGGTAALMAVAFGIGAGHAPAGAGGCAGEDRAVQSDDDVPAARAAVLCLVDQERRSRGLPGLVDDERLHRSAQSHSDDMVARNYFGHDAPDPSPNGRTADERARAWGYDPQLLRENIAGGLPVPREVVQAWLASEYHCEHMLDPDAAEIGVGIRPGAFADTPGPAWTMLVGIERSGVPPEADARPMHGCPYAQLGTGQPPAPEATATPAASSGDPAGSPPPGAPAAAPAPAASVAAGPSPPPRAALEDVRVRWVDGLLQISGRMRPGWSRHRIVARVQRGHRVARRVVRTTHDGRFVAQLSVRPDRRGGTAKVTVSGVPGRIGTVTASRRVPRGRRAGS